MKFNPKHEEWQIITPRNSIEFYINSKGLNLSNNFILITGGRLNSISKNDCYLYSKLSNTFFKFPELNISRYSHNIIFLNNYIFAIGGKFGESNSEGIITSTERISWEEIKLKYIKRDQNPDVEYLSLKKNTPWIEICQFNKARYNTISFVYNKEIYLIGGITSNGEISRFVEKYNFNENTWYFLNWKMPFKIAAASIIQETDNSELFFIIGGKNSNEEFSSFKNYIIDFKNKKYKPISCLKNRENPKVISFEDNIYIFGGDLFKTCEKFISSSFIYYQSESTYSSLIINDIVDYPSNEETIIIGKKKYSKEEKEEEKLEENSQKGEISPVVIPNPFKKNSFYYSGLKYQLEKYFLFGTENEPLILELNAFLEQVKVHSICFNFKFFSFGSSIRVNEDMIITIGGMIPSKGKVKKTVQVLSLINFKSKKLNEMNFNRCKFSSVIFPGERILIAGGISFENKNNSRKEIYLNSCEIYEIDNNSWKNIACLNFPRSNSLLFSLKDSVYCYGGYFSETEENNQPCLISSCEKYNYVDNTWIVLKFIFFENPLILMNFHIISDCKILIIGGGSYIDQKLEVFNDIWEIDLELEIKSLVGKINFPRIGHKLFRFDNNLIILGGNNNCNAVEAVKLPNFQIKPGIYQMFNDSISKLFLNKNLNGIHGA